MKSTFTIHEISVLYGIGPDSLRYYERLGLIAPARGENRYRLYALKDIYRLTIIRDLRALGFTMAQIKRYLEPLCMENTLALLADEEEALTGRIAQLRRTRASLRAREQRLRAAAALPDLAFQIAFQPPRRGLLLRQEMRRDEELDLAIKELHRRHQDLLLDMGSQTIGAAMRLSEMQAGIYGHYHSVFFLLTDEKIPADFQLPPGDYGQIVYRGGYERAHEALSALLEQVAAAGRQPGEELLEWYPVDNRFTLQREEFVTRLEVLLQ